MKFDRIPHVLHASKKTELPNRIVYFDSESRVPEFDDEEFIKMAQAERFEIKHEPYLCCATLIDRGSEHEEDYHGQDWQQRLWGDVARLCRKNSKVWCFAHNAKYDVLATGAIKYLVEYGFTVTAYSDSNPFFIRLVKHMPIENYVKKLQKKLETADTLAANELLIKISRVKNGELKTPSIGTILILSSTNFYNTSLKNLGKTFNLEKLDPAYNCTLEEAIPYCRRDVQILKLAMESFFDFVANEDLGNVGMTIASQAFNAYRHRFMQHDIFIHTNIPAIILERAAYSGGRTEAWHIGNCPGTVYGLDVNSMYPYVMLKEKFPVRLLSHRNRVTIADLKNFLDRGYLLTAKVKLITDRPIFPKRGKRLIFPVGIFWTSLCTPEIKYALEHNLIAEVEEIGIYEGDNIFEEYVNYFYNQRLKAKKNKDAVRDYLFKIFLNSLYGKFGQTIPEWERIGDADPIIVKAEHVYSMESATYEYYKTFGGSTFKKITPEIGHSESSNSFCAVAAHVTAYARMLLWDYAETAVLKNIFYMDTDSLMVNKKGFTNIEKAGHIDPKILGKLKLEKIGKMSIRGLKDYSFTGKDENNEKIKIDKIKGVNKNAIKIDENTYATSTWQGLAHAIETGNLDGYSQFSMIKELKREYTKGEISKSGRVIPICLNEEEIKNPIENNLILKFQNTILSLGGIKRGNHESLPSWCIQKEGINLDTMATLISQAGYFANTADDVYLLIWKYT